jgi:hypothetical protein
VRTATPERRDSPDFVDSACRMTRLSGNRRAELRPMRQTTLRPASSGRIARPTHESASEVAESGILRTASRRLPHRTHDPRLIEDGRR